mmetsp:Transcript_21766/g.64900  ORF Transcript_21766/g.64900 Transcript_21766/m.64900 type:complete len:337 (+) Transcript_21766:1128-2138(+)
MFGWRRRRSSSSSLQSPLSLPCCSCALRTILQATAVRQKVPLRTFEQPPEPTTCGDTASSSFLMSHPSFWPRFWTFSCQAWLRRAACLNILALCVVDGSDSSASERSFPFSLSIFSISRERLNSAVACRLRSSTMMKKLFLALLSRNLKPRQHPAIVKKVRTPKRIRLKLATAPTTIRTYSVYKTRMYMSIHTMRNQRMGRQKCETVTRALRPIATLAQSSIRSVSLRLNTLKNMASTKRTSRRTMQWDTSISRPRQIRSAVRKLMAFWTHLKRLTTDSERERRDIDACVAMVIHSGSVSSLPCRMVMTAALPMIKSTRTKMRWKFRNSSSFLRER